ncbi:hypothetical protein VSP53_21915 [Escherichia coli]|uniref:hypothetical protein n=1 Tax=Escherichia coli TaxID=562 RepID=UPI00191AFE26|nr:hypothetical protein [Escherichia coli]EHR9216919.1 hypothetical protein [Escherichia coli]EIM2959707.1 hypothetical protein [Escherichia coli]EJA8548120.1 hypothetical protein [Escherichia coli]EJF6575386.1 hypothetical protein [Escherichia coli]MCV7919950.1 formylglycine-generating enzyme family protein [Escherichia coli]
MYLNTQVQYNKLNKDEKKILLLQKLAHLTDFTFDRIETFSAFGQSTETGVFKYKDGNEFVVVPGDTVILGWDASLNNMDGPTKQEFEEMLEPEGLDLNNYLTDSCTPVRKVTISPMLVERNVHAEPSWKEVSLTDPRITENSMLQKFLSDYMEKINPGVHELNARLRLQYIDGDLFAQIYESISYDELLQNIQSNSFDLPSEDEWEYLCGGGSRTLWRWGNNFDYQMKIPFITSEEPTTWDIEWPNQFGLQIAFDPYLQEIINDKDILLKGGDGGCNLCGGANVVLGFLPVATYYKGYNKHTDELEYMDDIGDNYTSYRRIIRL